MLYMSNPLISIVICCHNRHDLVLETLKTVFEQKYEPVEIVVYDDGSTDGTSELLQQYGNKIKYKRGKQVGIAAARNRACQLASGEYIAFQDDDDLMPPDRVVNQFAALQKFPEAVFATGDFMIIDHKGKLTGERHLPGSPDDYAEPKLIGNSYKAVLWPEVPVCPHTSLFRKIDGEKAGWFDENFKYSASDKDFYARLALLGPIIYMREVSSFYRRGHSSIRSKIYTKRFGDLQLWGKHLNIVENRDFTLKQRIKFRLISTLKDIASDESTGTLQTKPELSVLYKQSLALLNTKDRFILMLFKYIKLPIRNIVKNISNKTSCL